MIPVEYSRYKIMNEKTKKTIKERIGILGVGLVANTLIVYVFDYLLYPLAINRWGLFYGGHVMIWASLLICLISFEFYDWAKTDWVGIETLKEIREDEDEISIIKKAKWLEFLILSIQTDPFIVTIFMRKGAHRYDGLSKTDWQVFFGSLFVGNLFWILGVYFGLEVAKVYGFTMDQIMMVLLLFVAIQYTHRYLHHLKFKKVTKHKS